MPPDHQLKTALNRKQRDNKKKNNQDALDYEDYPEATKEDVVRKIKVLKQSSERDEELDDKEIILREVGIFN